MHITVESNIIESPRVQQLRGLFDLPPHKTSKLGWDVDLPLTSKPWNIGLICGPSGCGKSTLARHLWPNELMQATLMVWTPSTSIIDDFPQKMSIKDVTALLSSVGFSSPPAWLRPFRVLSTGQQFRVTMARLLAEATSAGSCKPVVVDEYTSVVDRTVAQVGSAAISKTVRERHLQFVAVSCHEDIIPWLNPDWVYKPAEESFAWRFLQRRPAVPLEVFRCHHEAWHLFAPHHYLSHSLALGASCFLATWDSRPVCFSSWLPFVGAGPPTRREHRTVTLPDFQGIGIGNHVSDLIASMWKGLGYRAISTTTHPAMIQARNRSINWTMHRAPSLAHSSEGKLSHATNRLTAGFAYSGPPMPYALAKALCT
jgi:ABC-type phosphate/phosphonate transport system ATPase subunit/GNAT superfamily N-acetyltransferase